MESNSSNAIIWVAYKESKLWKNHFCFIKEIEAFSSHHHTVFRPVLRATNGSVDALAKEQMDRSFPE